MDHHYNRGHKTDESVGQQIIFEFGICIATLLAIGIACELAFARPELDCADASKRHVQDTR